MKIIFVFGIFLLCGELFSQVRLYGDTNFPARSMYIPGEKIEIRLRAEGLRQGEQSEKHQPDDSPGQTGGVYWIERIRKIQSCF